MISIGASLPKANHSEGSRATSLPDLHFRPQRAEGYIRAFGCFMWMTLLVAPFWFLNDWKESAEAKVTRSALACQVSGFLIFVVCQWVGRPTKTSNAPPQIRQLE